MTDLERIRREGWTLKQAILLAAACLATGIAVGWAIRASHTPAPAQPGTVASAPAPAVPAPSAQPQQPSPAQLKSMADAQAAPILDKLKADPGNPDLLTSAGNLYYDAQQYSAAVDFYGRALKARPADAAVRTDMATAYWYMGDADTALAEFDKALTYAPSNANTLFNRGLVRWRGKKDGAGALSDWQKLLDANPNYEQKDKVLQMISEIKQQGAQNKVK